MTGPPELPEGSSSSSSELDPLRREVAVREMKRGSNSHSPRKPLADPPEKARHVRNSEEAMRSNAALQGIMEQGGRFEIKLKKLYDGSGTTPPPHIVEDPMAKAALELSQSQVSSTSLPLDSSPGDLGAAQNDSESTMRPLGGSNTFVTKSSKPNHITRPTYVQLPSPKVYPSEDETPPPTTEMSSSLSTQESSGDKMSISNLKAFDNNFSRGSPSASYAALNIEPNLPVLVVDDDLITRTLMKRILTRLGCSVSCAENGEVALHMILGQHITTGSTPESDSSANGPILEPTLYNPEQSFNEEGKYAVVFLDNQMPVMSGLTVVAKLREMERCDFVVGVTGNALLSGKFQNLLGYAGECS